MGLPSAEFDRMAISDVAEWIENRNKTEEQQLKKEIQLLHFLAKDVAQILGATEEHPPKEPWDFFPELFGQDKKEYEEQRAEAEMSMYKARMIDYALQHNNRRKEADGWKE